MTSSNVLPSRVIPSQNIVSRLLARETFGLSKTRSNKINTAQGFYTNIFPNYTLVNVEKPPCFLRKFTPDGKRFIAFSSCQTSLEIYDYLGSSSCGELIEGTTGDFLSNSETPENTKIRNIVFQRFFKLAHSVPLSYNGEQLNRECSLFSQNGKYVVVTSAIYIQEDPHPPFHELYRSNESVSSNPRNPLEDYTFYSVELSSGRLVDKISFKTDKIFLSHNQGLYLYKSILAILSVQHQTIHMYKLTSNGSFVPIVQIGRLLRDDDEHLLSSTLRASIQTRLPGRVGAYREYRETSINLLKHRILVFLYKRASYLSSYDGHPGELRKFYQYFDQLRSLRMWKIQLLDESHILIKYASEDVVTLRCHEPNSQPSFFVVYNISSTNVIAIYDNSSQELLDIFESFTDFFRNSYDDKLVSSPSNNIHARLLQERFKQTILSAKNGGCTEARKRVLAQLPISAQSYTTSPYLDISLFSYDEKWVSLMERPKACGEHPIQFYGRQCGLLKFKIYAGVQGRVPPPPNARRLVAFIFHPIDPFAISVQRTNLEYVVNFHVRKSPSSP